MAATTNAIINFDAIPQLSGVELTQAQKDVLRGIASLTWVLSPKTENKPEPEANTNTPTPLTATQKAEQEKARHAVVVNLFKENIEKFVKFLEKINTDLLAIGSGHHLRETLKVTCNAAQNLMHLTVESEVDFECFDKALQETAKSLERFNTINNVSTDLPDLLKELVRNPLWLDFGLMWREIMTVEDIRNFFVVKPEELVNILTQMNKTFNETLQATEKYTRKEILRVASKERGDASQIIQNTGLIAAFFSGITVTMMQFTLDSADATEPMGVTVNIFMFSSLVFSVSSIINSILLTLWLGSGQRAPQYCMPRWLSNVFLGGPNAYALISGLLFSSGMTLFVFSSQRSIVTRVVVPLLVTIHSAALCFFVLVYLIMSDVVVLRAITRIIRSITEVLKRNVPTGQPPEETEILPPRHWHFKNS